MSKLDWKTERRKRRQAMALIRETSHNLSVLHKRHGTFTVVRAFWTDSGGHTWSGEGVAKYNNADRNVPGLEYSSQRGRDIALGRAIKDIAEQYVMSDAPVERSVYIFEPWGAAPRDNRLTTLVMWTCPACHHRGGFPARGEHPCPLCSTPMVLEVADSPAEPTVQEAGNISRAKLAAQKLCREEE